MLVLVLNCGSSSVKTRLVDTETGGWLLRGSVDRIGDPEEPGKRRLEKAGAEAQETRAVTAGHREALRWIAEEGLLGLQPEAVGHRVVHGGEDYVRPTLVRPEVLEDLERLSDLAPLHNPPNLEGIRVAREVYPHLPQVAVFDTAFHATLPDYAYRYAIPEEYYRRHGIRRYGFHGPSHQYVSERARRMLGRDDAKLVVLHLGNGCSAAAVCGGQSVDTSMGLTPLEGLIMGTRCGDLDPAAPLVMQAGSGLSDAQLDALLNRECGLKALSGGDSDMRDIEARMRAGDDRARLAFQAFCYRARKYVGAYAAAMGGLDALVFTAGIGENSAAARAGICAGLEFLGLRIEERANEGSNSGEREIGEAGAPARVLVIPTDEELVIARETAAVVAAASPGPETGPERGVQDAAGPV